MIINSSNSNSKIQHLAQTVSQLIIDGRSSNEILILCLNSFKKEKILAEINKILQENKIEGCSQINVTTFAGITYNSLLKNWIKIENLIQKTGGETEIYPILSGLDASQYFFNKIIKEEDFKDYFSKKNLMHQLLRRYKLIVENSLSDTEIDLRSQILNESFGPNALKAINSYKLASSKNRIFDNLKQISSFLYLLKNGQINDFNYIKYFFADDIDEYSFAAFDFCNYMIKAAQKSFLYLDKEGCSRQGYLCGYSGAYDDLKNNYSFEEINLSDNSKLSIDAENLIKNIIKKENNELINFESFSYSKRLEMLEKTAEKISALIKNGVKKNEITIITPLIDENLIYSLQEFFKPFGYNLQFLTGNKKITEDIYVYATITILQLLNKTWNIKPNYFDVRILLNEILQIPILECKNILAHFNKTNDLPTENIPQFQQYKILIELINNQELQNSTLSEQFEEIFARIIAPNAIYGDDFESINLLLKSINEFEKIKENFAKFDNINLSATDWLLHIKNSIVAQNPSKPTHIKQESIIVSTAQKISDFSIKSKYQFWLDTSSLEWLKEDTGTIYNSWVFQKNYTETNFSSEINQRLTLEKNAKLLRKLILNATEKIFVYSSNFDSTGRENSGELINFIKTSTDKPKEFKFVARDDQKEILEYTGGKLAIPAVPGAGKTTIMLALLFELVKKSIKPQEILVLTYMESAARNFLNRYKKITQSPNNLPQISTIHAFAFKILMENNNYSRVNLPEDFSICDDNFKTTIVKEICAKNLPIGENLEDFTNLMLNAISKSKINNLDYNLLKEAASKDINIKEFAAIYHQYQEKLKELSMLDYDDLLVCAIKLLEHCQDIAEFYQTKFKYIIEDEAQDSSAIQQHFINILSKKYNNVIRCGDVNQAILGTFSNSDVRGFKDFINNNKKIEMYRSQRCAKQIYSLANNLVEHSKENSFSKDAFYDLKIEGVEGKNPISNDSLEYKAFENQIEEKEFIIKDIRDKIQKNPARASYAILLRTNKQVSAWANYIEQQGLRVICRGDSYKQRKIFSFILCAIELFLTPWDNKIAAQLYKEFCNIEKFKFDENLYQYIHKNENIFFHPDFLKTNNINNKDIENFWWEGFSIIESKTLNIQKIIITCANRYFSDITDKSNAYLFSILIKRYENNLANSDNFKLNYIPEIIKYFKNLLNQNGLKGINLFSKEDEDENYNDFVQILTIHKSKGAEFDYVYLPEFTDYNYTLNFSRCSERIKKHKKTLLQKLDKLILGQNILISQNAKEEIEETLRLIYVAITRAKLGLNFSYSKKNNFKGNNQPVEIIDTLISQAKICS